MIKTPRVRNRKRHENGKGEKRLTAKDSSAVCPENLYSTPSSVAQENEEIDRDMALVMERILERKGAENENQRQTE